MNEKIKEQLLSIANIFPDICINISNFTDITINYKLFNLEPVTLLSVMKKGLYGEIGNNCRCWVDKSITLNYIKVAVNGPQEFKKDLNWSPEMEIKNFDPNILERFDKLKIYW